MKSKVFILSLASVLALSSCSTTGGGAMTGAMFGGIIGSCIGGIGGGPRGSDIGTLVGMAVGAGTGAAIGAAAEKEERAQFEAHRDAIYQGREYPVRNGNKERQTPTADTGYSADPVYDDVITMDADTTVSEPVDTIAEVQAAPILISNAHFINNAGTTHIDKGELVKVSFEMRNASDKSLYNVVPLIQETTGNKHLLISPSTLIERIPVRGALRYTAYISAERSLKTGTAHFMLSVTSANQVISNTIEFDVPLN
ncbi:MAG: hypothetical protein IJV10_03650 [Prevotella sp.]|nr:hypothetical protein [Prevotella sp.]